MGASDNLSFAECLFRKLKPILKTCVFLEWFLVHLHCLCALNSLFPSFLNSLYYLYPLPFIFCPSLSSFCFMLFFSWISLISTSYQCHLLFMPSLFPNFINVVLLPFPSMLSSFHQTGILACRRHLQFVCWDKHVNCLGRSMCMCETDTSRGAELQNKRKALQL